MEFPRNDVAAFLEAARTGSVSRAASRLGLTQPSVSKAIRRLEGIVGVPLLERSSQGVRLTGEGELFVESAKRYEAQHHDLVRLSTELRARHAGLLRIGITSPAAESVLVQAVSELIRRRPGLRVQLQIGKSDELNAAVADGALDFAMVPSYPGQTWSCAHTTLATEEIRVVARHQHPLTRLPSVSIHDLSAQHWVMASHPSAIRRILSEVFLQQGAPAPQVALEVDFTSDVSMGILVSTDLISIVPSPMYREWLGRLVLLTVPELKLQRSQVLLARDPAYWSPLMVDLRDLCLSQQAD